MLCALHRLRRIHRQELLDDIGRVFLKSDLFDNLANGLTQVASVNGASARSDWLAGCTKDGASHAADAGLALRCFHCCVEIAITGEQALAEAAYEALCCAQSAAIACRLRCAPE